MVAEFEQNPRMEENFEVRGRGLFEGEERSRARGFRQAR
jgi:hypothetical protein